MGARSWNRTAAWRSFDAAVRAIDPADDVAAMAAAQALLASLDLDALLAPLLKALASRPMDEIPFRSSRDSLRTVLLLHESPTATVSVTHMSAAALAGMSLPETVVATGRQSVTRIVRGFGEMRRWRVADGIAAEIEAVDLSPGDLVACDGRRECQLVSALADDQVTMRVSLAASALPFVREFPAVGGAAIRRAPANDRGSRMLMLLSYLRAAGRRVDGAAFAVATEDPDFTLRWAAMREWLMLDLPGALPRLRALADGDLEAEVRTAASATLRRVMERAPCPA